MQPEREGARRHTRTRRSLRPPPTPLRRRPRRQIIEPIQSRCAIVRFTRLSDAEVVERLLRVIEAEKVPYVPDGLEAVVFTADGDMRQGLNNLQATNRGFGLVSQDNVFKARAPPGASDARLLSNNHRCQACARPLLAGEPQGARVRH